MPGDRSGFFVIHPSQPFHFINRTIVTVIAIIVSDKSKLSTAPSSSSAPTWYAKGLAYWPHVITYSILLVLFLHSRNFSRVEKVIDIFQEALVDDLRVGEEEDTR